MKHTGRIGSAVFVTSVCVSLAVGVMAPPAAAAPTPEPGQTSAPQVTWGSCQRFLGDDADALRTAQCAAVPVPISDADPAGPQAQLAVIKIPASGERIGALFINPGGPGASAVDAAAGMGYALAGSPIAEHFDIVGFDPRGVGYSTPEVRCRTDAEFDAWRRDPMVDYSPAGVAAIEQINRDYAKECADKMGTAFLAGLGTDSAAKDMDTIRQVLGDDKINYLGFSYGTELGTAYLEKFANRVRAMVLDGAIDPAQDTVDSIIQQMDGFQVVFNDYAADCAKSAGCPLGTDPAHWVDRFHQLVDPLVTNPGPTSDPRGLSYTDAITGTFNALYTPQYWKFLTSGLLGLQRQTDAGDLLMLADEYEGRNLYGHYNNGQDAFNAVRCVDAPTPTDPAVWAEIDRRTRELAPFQAYGQFTGFAPRDLCAFWPVPPTSEPHPAPPAPPGSVVVVSTTHDPATPYEAGVGLARELGAPLVTYDGTQHTVVFNGDECIDLAIMNYFINLTPPVNLHC
ncbi:alpha/beta hydrolase [Mycobacterium sp. CVI_P3]|uniref:Alpha/beta hydrolase n=2 Tax=Mycobacterium pinniadriaticum TaxID=2994102 RepID=A0ABT3SHU7_9MYCO|nr:alpha/beta hydrolase [Mycobacterium pinniadriaticum]MCX2939106.1 alpha/beta hydrolase [Mycobacterium pinniadriaticum]